MKSEKEKRKWRQNFFPAPFLSCFFVTGVYRNFFAHSLSKQDGSLCPNAKINAGSLELKLEVLLQGLKVLESNFLRQRSRQFDFFRFFR
jgi:hypothetical protein